MPKKETPEEKEYRESVEKIATNIQALATAVQSVVKGPLKRKTLLVLLANSSGYSQTAVGAIIDSMASMDKDFLK